MSERIMVAMTGGSSGDHPVGMMCEGYCVPLAATPLAQEAIESVGEDQVADWLEQSGSVAAPHAGGLWVLECEIGETAEGLQIVDSFGWRPPNALELLALVERQMARACGDKPEPPSGIGRWVFLGAMV